jgi:hypothetical protein
MFFAVGLMAGGLLILGTSGFTAYAKVYEECDKM